LAQAQEWQEAERVAYSIEVDEHRSTALSNLASALAQAGAREHAQGLRHLAERVIRTNPDSFLPSWKKPSNPPPSLGETIITDLTSQETTAIVKVTAIATALIGTLTFIAKQWSKRHSTNRANPMEHTSQLSETDIVSVRLRMTHGDDPEFEEWLTDPDRLRHYIDVFNQPSSPIQPLYAIFVQRSGKEIKVDVSRGAQNNLQLDELLNYLNADPAQDRISYESICCSCVTMLVNPNIPRLTRSLCDQGCDKIGEEKLF
jgi:hypothetical protein